jgi:hypothetical protein
MHWLSKVSHIHILAYIRLNLDQQPAWGRSREFDITTRSLTRGGIIQNTAGDLEEGDEDESLVHGKKKRRVTFIPSIGKLSGDHRYIND